MNNNRIIKGLLVALMLNCATTPLQADWLAPIRNFFNNPTQEKLIVSCTLAGISLLTAGTAFYFYRKLGKLYEAQEKMHQDTKSVLMKENDNLEKEKQKLTKKLATARRKIGDLKAKAQANHNNDNSQRQQYLAQSAQPYLATAASRLQESSRENRRSAFDSADEDDSAAADPSGISGFGSIERLEHSEGTGTLKRFYATQIQQVERDADRIMNTCAQAADGYRHQNPTPSPAATANNNSDSAQEWSPLQPLKDQVEDLEKEMEKEDEESGYRALVPTSPSTSPKNSN